MIKAILPAVLLSLSTLASASSLVTNGSFENPGVSSGSYTTLASIPGWTSTDGIEIRNNVSGTASAGSNYVELDTYRNSSITQAITTTLGQIYKLTFDYSPRINQPASTNGIAAYWNGVQLLEVTGTGAGVNVWTTFSALVTGTGGSDLLKFAATGTSNRLGGNIDDVNLSAVPLPGAALLFGSALLGSGALRRKQKSATA